MQYSRCIATFPNNAKCCPRGGIRHIERPELDICSSRRSVKVSNHSCIPRRIWCFVGRMSKNPSDLRSGVLMVWCDRPRSGRGPDGRLDELNLLASDYHYVCPSDYTRLEIRDLSKAKDPRVLLRRCPKCRTTWYGPTLSELRSRPAGMSGPLRRTEVLTDKNRGKCP